ncbi:MAG TPA: hypothetical protein VK249_17595 [Anaerolineales bacterium]|nr:hypothetical protein [Anaerolineales bacterium]
MYYGSTFKKQRVIALSTLALVVSTAIILYYIATRPEKYHLLTTWTSTENGVKVKIDVIKYLSGELKLSGTFTPTRQGFHLYSKDLPKDGLGGLGRPTLLEIVKSDSIKITGPLEADRPVQDITFDILGISLPVYPAGSVVLSLPFEFVTNDNLASMDIAITYMACSDKTCLPPVIGKHISIQVPSSFFED